MGFSTPGQEAADTVLSYFRTGKRDNGDTYYYTENAPEWVTDMIHEAHGDMLPDDWAYSMVRGVLMELSDGATLDEVREQSVDDVYPYTSDRTQWLASNLSRTAWVDEVATATPDPLPIFALLGYAMMNERAEIATIVARYIGENIEDTDA